MQLFPFSSPAGLPSFSGGDAKHDGASERALRELAIALTCCACVLACGDDAADAADAGASDAAAQDGSAEDVDGGDMSSHDGAVDDTDGGTDVGDSGEPTLLDNLRALGVPTDSAPLQDDDGEPIPASYSPFGPVLELGRRNEIFVVGPKVATDPATLLDDGLETPAYPVLASFPELDWPWALESTDVESRPGTIRAAAAGDLLPDGVEELAIVYLDADAHQLRLKLLHGDDMIDETDELLVDMVDQDGEVNDVAVVAGDFDGDGYEDLAVGYVIVTETETSPGVFSVRSDATVLSVNVSSGVAEVARAPIATIAGRLAQSFMTLSLAAGRLDYDDGEELVVVASELAPINPSNSGVGRARARYFVLDDSQHGFAALRSGDVIGEDGNGEVLVAPVASVTVGDLDADSFDEIVLAGLSWRDSYDLSGCESISYIVVGIDDGRTSFRDLGSTRVQSQLPVCDNDGRAARMQHVHVNALNADGTGGDEVQVNEVLLSFDAAASPVFELLLEAPAAAFFAGCADQPYNRATSAVAVGDFTGDGREQVLHYCAQEQGASLWGAEPGETALTLIDSVAFSETGVYPILVGVNVAHDGSVNADGEVTAGSQVLELMAADDAGGQYVLTEPIVLAALAAPPCIEGIGQNVDACVTSFGQGESVSLERESSYKMQVTAGLGLNVMGGVVTQSEADLVAKIGVAFARATSSNTTLSKSITYTTGPLEDTIVFAVVPYSMFRYRVRSAFDETMIGSIVSVFLPHEPTVQQAERGFYNAHVLDDSDRIGSDVFAHTVGDISTYPRAEDVLPLLRRHCDDREFPPCTALQAGPQAVGQGQGATELGLEIATEQGLKGELALTGSIEAETTIATVKVTLEFEQERAWSIGTTVGESVSFTGSVGAIGAEDFAGNQYSFGMFAYAYGARGRFHVVNYWVE